MPLAKQIVIILDLFKGLSDQKHTRIQYYSRKAFKIISIADLH